MRLYKLNDRAISVKGNAAGFLNGITSNTLEAPLNAFLNQHGRIIATFRQERINDDAFMLYVPGIAVDNLLKHLDRYAKLSRVSLTLIDHPVYMDIESMRMVMPPDHQSNGVTDDEFTLFRLNNSIPLMGIDYQANEFILNVHELEYVSYTKGCFLGQEPVAKVHNRSHPTRTLVVRFKDECTPEEQLKMTSMIEDPFQGKLKGFVFVGHQVS